MTACWCRRKLPMPIHRAVDGCNDPEVCGIAASPKRRRHMKNIGAMVAIAAVASMIGCTTMMPQQQRSLQRIKHVFVITLENKSYDVTFGPNTQAVYLNGTLKPMGALLTNYYATGHVSHDNYIAMISGQPASLDTQSDCQVFRDFH